MVTSHLLPSRSHSLPWISWPTRILSPLSFCYLREVPYDQFHLCFTYDFKRKQRLNVEPRGPLFRPSVCRWTGPWFLGASRLWLTAVQLQLKISVCLCWLLLLSQATPNPLFLTLHSWNPRTEELDNPVQLIKKGLGLPLWSYLRTSPRGLALRLHVPHLIIQASLPHPALWTVQNTEAIVAPHLLSAFPSEHI